MATQYTSILKLALPTQGELDGTWGGVVNDNITSMVEEAIAGLSTINTWTTDSHTLTTANGVTSESRAAMLVLTDTGTALTGAGEVICPTATKIYIVKNDTGQTITVKTSAGTGVDIPTGTIRIVFCDGTNVVQASASLSGLGVTATATELNYVDGVTSAIQTQLDSKVGSLADLGITATATELNYTDGVTSAIQTQLDSKVGSLTDLGVTATSAELNILDGATLTTAELNYVDGVTSAIQTQINSKAPIASPTFTGTVTIPTADINGGNIDSTVIGASTAVAGTFTALAADYLNEGVYNLTGTDIDPANGSIQYKVLSTNTTFTESLSSGDSVILRLAGGATYTVTWPTITWVTGTGNAAPTLAGNDTVVLWKENTTLYGAYVGYF